MEILYAHLGVLAGYAHAVDGRKDGHWTDEQTDEQTDGVQSVMNPLKARVPQQQETCSSSS